MRPAHIELHIEELVLHGFALGDRYRISEAVERELVRLFAEQGVPPAIAQNIGSDHVNAGTFKVVPDAKAAVIGAQVAQAVYGGLSE